LGSEASRDPLASKYCLKAGRVCNNPWRPDCPVGQVSREVEWRMNRLAGCAAHVFVIVLEICSIANAPNQDRCVIVGLPMSAGKMAK